MSFQGINSIKYKPEIEGLRALAVVAVIINHFNQDILQSGYLGVDIFFVISGYVITSSLESRESNNLSDLISSFYERRIKRIFPALIVYILPVTIIICILNPTPGHTVWTGIFSLFGASNFRLLHWSDNYFAISPQFNVFLHTWSLAVEEQFYFIYPFLIWFSGFGQKRLKGSRNLFFSVFLISTFSLIYFIFLYANNKSAAFFLMPSRFWEIGSGCLVFLIHKKNNILLRIPENLLSSTIFFLMIGVLFMPLSSTIQSTILIVFLTALLILFIIENSLPYKILTQSRLIYIGKISYSLYLWHWGVISISRWTIGIHFWTIPIQVLIIFFLAHLSYKWIETPIRKINNKGKILNNIFLGFITLILTFLSIIIISGPLHKYLYLGKYPLEDFEIALLDKEAYKIGDDINSLETKIVGNSIYIYGDSHAEQLLLGVKSISTDIGFKHVFLVKDINEFKYLSKNDLIVYSNSANTCCKDDKRQIIQKLKDIAIQTNSKLIIVDDVAPFGENGDSDFLPKFTLFKDGPIISRATAEERRKPHTKMLLSYVDNINSFYIDPLPKVCGLEFCTAVINDTLIYADYSPHLNKKGSILLKDLWLENLPNIINVES